MMKFRENEEAVSPVIGVILMVAITVILAAVIAAFVFGMTDNIDPQKEVYATTKMSFDEDKNPILIVTIQGGKDVDLVDKIECIIGTEAKIISGLDTGEVELGKSGTIELDGFTTLADPGVKNHIIIRATFTDNSKKIIVETDYTKPTP